MHVKIYQGGPGCVVLVVQQYLSGICQALIRFPSRKTYTNKQNQKIQNKIYLQPEATGQQLEKLASNIELKS